MEISVLEQHDFSQDGASLLNLIQNNELTKIDFLVRESIQNSLDAALGDVDKVNVDFFVDSCDTQQLNHIFTGIELELSKDFSTPKSDFLAIRDSNTTGLTGPLYKRDIKGDDHGNLRKLIYEISQRQEGKGAGGSWGLGKTVYFRIGIGLVLYYSRIKTVNGYESRMAATLVENNKDPNSLLRRAGLKEGPSYCGVAWWGKAEGDERAPITDENEILKILKTFQLPPYRDDETGTTIIIPYINKDALQKDANRQENQQENSKLAGLPLETFIDCAVMRWYSPRLYNKEVYPKYTGNPWLNYRIKKSTKSSLQRVMLTEYPFFSLMQQLYNGAVSKNEKDGVEIKIRPIYLKKAAGFLKWCKVSSDHFRNGKLPLSPLESLMMASDEEQKKNPPILAYCRKAGLIVNYETEGRWLKGVPDTDVNSYLIAFFVPYIDTPLGYHPDISLDEYLRKCESADHRSWEDHKIGDSQYWIVKNIRNKVRSNLAGVVKPQEKTDVKRGEKFLRQSMGKAFLPPGGLGNLNSHQKPKGHTSAKPSRRSQTKSGEFVDLSDMSVNYLANHIMSVTWKITFSKGISQIIVNLYAFSGRAMDASQWESPETGLGTDFPLQLKEFEAETPAGKEVPVFPVKSSREIVSAYTIHTALLSFSKQPTIELECHALIHTADPAIGWSIDAAREGSK